MGFDDVAREHGPALVRVAYLLCHDAGRAEDLAQDALVKAHRHWQRHGPPDHPAAYLRRIVLTEYLGWRRRRWSSEWVGLGAHDSALEDHSDAVDDRDLAWRAMATLSQRQRTVLVLRYYEALPDKEIAALLGCTEATVRSLAARALAKLRDDPELRASTSGHTLTDPAEEATT